jgi:hypothetical protein
MLEPTNQYPRQIVERPATLSGFVIVVLASLTSACLTEFGVLPFAAAYLDEAFRLGAAASVVLLVMGVGVVVTVFTLIHQFAVRRLEHEPRLPNQLLRSLARLAESVAALTLIGVLIRVGNHWGVPPHSPVTDLFVASPRPSATKLAGAAAVLVVAGFTTGIRTGAGGWGGTQAFRGAGAARRDARGPTQT